MATATKRRPRVAAPVVEQEDLFLQDILALPEPSRTHSLQEWMEEAETDMVSGGVVKIGTASGKAMTFPFDGQRFSIPPMGKHVSRNLAVRLLLHYGIKGRYRGRDQATGMSESDRLGLTKEMREHYIDSGTYNLNFNSDYLLQIPEGNELIPEENTNEPT